MVVALDRPRYGLHVLIACAGPLGHQGLEVGHGEYGTLRRAHLCDRHARSLHDVRRPSFPYAVHEPPEVLRGVRGRYGDSASATVSGGRSFAAHVPYVTDNEYFGQPRTDFGIVLHRCVPAVVR